MTRLRRHRHLSEAEGAREARLQQLQEAGSWNQLFERQGDLWLEVGTGKDTHLMERSIQHPKDLHIGIEYCRKKFELTLRKAQALGCGANLRLVHANAFDAIDPVFPDRSLAGGYILFPDPWPKARHARRRLLQSSFLLLIARKLQAGAPLEIRTDDPDYALQALEELKQVEPLEYRTEHHGWLLEPLDQELHVETLFEKRFLSKGQPIHHFYLRKSGDGPAS